MFPFKRSDTGEGTLSRPASMQSCRPKRVRRRAITLGMTLALMASVLIPSAVLAAAPANDSFAQAIPIDVSALPYNAIVDNTEATTEPGEPWGCGPSQHTVWYSMTPDVDGVFVADMVGTGYGDTALTVYTAPSPDLAALSYVGNGCWFFGPSRVTFRAQAGATYYFQAGDTGSGGGSLHLNVTAVPAPANDDFANATLITSLPFADVVDATASTVEPGEPSPSCLVPLNSVWYKITPSTSASLTVNLPDFWNSVAVYSGQAIDSLTQVSCRNYGGLLTFGVQAGVTYYLQLVPLLPFGNGVLHLNIDVAPPPQANFYHYPSDPSVFDAIQFNDTSYDPAGVGIATEAWDFGDGTIATGCCPAHRFATDGNYTVTLAITTFDGRTASTSQAIGVATHDVAIAKLTTPTSASASQTRQITIGITNGRYVENVQVQLYKSNSIGGFDLVGTLVQSVPVRGGNRTTSFTFNYTFTSADAAIGKVTFKADATILGARDALPGDNQAIALPTKVNK
jgi:PKD repeat protein